MLLDWFCFLYLSNIHFILYYTLHLLSVSVDMLPAFDQKLKLLKYSKCSVTALFSNIHV